MGTITCRNKSADSTPIVGCLVQNLMQLRECMLQGGKITLLNDITVTEADCDGNGVLNFSGLSDITLCGQGLFKIFRESGQQTCSLVHGSGANNIIFKDICFEETPGEEVPPLDTYARMFHFIGGSNICFMGAEVAHSWDYAIYTNGVQGFKFLNSILRDSGVLGLYIGHTAGNPTCDVQVRNSTFLNNTTNAIAVLGGKNVDISNNVFCNNHVIGVFLVDPQFGTGYTGGGQIYLAVIDDFVLKNNDIKDGLCPNCANTWVTGIEYGVPNAGVQVTNGLVMGNNITNNTGHGMGVNVGAILGPDVVIMGNTETGNGLPSQYSNSTYTP